MNAQLFINDIEVLLGTQPQGLEEFKVSLKRDTIYSGIDTTLDIEIKFFCTSGKEEIDAIYQANGLDANAYIQVTDTCGTDSVTFKYKLDFKNFQTNADFCTCNLVQLDDLSSGASNWKDDLKRTVNLTLEGVEEDLYVRNLPLVYNYDSDNIYGQITSTTQNTEHNTGLNPSAFPWLVSGPPFPAPPPVVVTPANYYQYVAHYIMPKVDTNVNELEDSDGLLADYFHISEPWNLSPNIPNYKTGEYIDILNVSSTRSDITYSDVEPPAIFENKLDDGEFNIVTNQTQMKIDIDGLATVSTNLIEINEIIFIGKQYDNPRIVIKNAISTSSSIISSPAIITFPISKSLTRPIQMFSGESVWIYYELIYKSYEANAAFWNGSQWNFSSVLQNVFAFYSLKYTISNSIIASFTITRDVRTVLAGSALANIEPFHTKVKAYKGELALNRIFKTDNNLAETPCFEDIWFTDGQRMRNKINMSDFIVKPVDIFTELEKITCCGLGVVYDVNGNATLQLQDVYFFYSDNLVHSFTEGEIANFRLSNITSNYYNEIKIGYATFKDTEKDYCKLNEYTISNKGESIYNKVTEWIASKYIVTKAMKLSTDDKELEFDKNIFLLSSTTATGSPNDINFTLAESVGVSDDNMTMNPNVLGLNRRYASVMNLFRHLYKWGFSLFVNKDTLKVNKYEGSTIYEQEIKHDLGTPTSPYYQGLSVCKLPLDLVKVDRDIIGMYTNSPNTYDGFINRDLFVPMAIEFEVYNLTSIDLLRLRSKQYGLFSVVSGGVEYFGNLMSATHDNGVTKFNLLRRFKNGI